ncbi:MAG: bifunctional molybdenum cofactor biosynthesis protein MoaC/MoaB [Bacteroidota bacterium]
MIDITHKNTTLRTATAQATVVVSSPETVAAIREDRVPKGNVFAMSKAAGLLGVKKTAELLPDCHPMPIEATRIDFRIEGLELIIEVAVMTIYKTGVEVEAMHGASIVALNAYDMLKPIDKGIEIRNIRLLEKRGGKSDVQPQTEGLTAAVVVCSDTISQGDGEDRSGKIIHEHLEGLGIATRPVAVIPDEVAAIRAEAQQLQEAGTDLILFSGGTGLSPRDVTPEALTPLLDRQLPGMEEALRHYGQQRLPYAMLSRSVIGTMGNSLVMALPGSTGAARDAMAALFPAVLHAFQVMKGSRHD